MNPKPAASRETNPDARAHTDRPGPPAARIRHRQDPRREQGLSVAASPPRVRPRSRKLPGTTRRGPDGLQAPRHGGPDAARLIQAQHKESALVFHSADESETALLDAIDAGATAYLTKDATAEQIIEAVRRAAQGEVLIPVELFARAIARQRAAVTRKREREQLLAEFTPRELDILHLLAEGLDTGEMSSRLGIAPHTVEWHVRHVIEKLQVHSKLQAVISAARKGLIEL